jgi:UPF0716 family protein affecting phage T7 exclusion
MNRRLLYSLFLPHGLLNYIMGLLLVGLLIMLDTLGTMFVASYLGAYLALALSAISMWVSLLLMWGSLYRHSRRIRHGARQGLFLQLEFIQVCALLVGTFLVVLPGFLTDLFAWLIYIPPFRIALGTIIFRRYRQEFNTVYEELQANGD